MKIDIVPTFKNIAVVPVKDVKAKETEAAGIILPSEDASNATSRKGTIIAVGPSVDVKALSIGDVVVYRDYGYEKVQVNEDTVLVMADENVVAKFRETAV